MPFCFPPFHSRALRRYYDDAAIMLRRMVLQAVAPHMYSPITSRKLPWDSSEEGSHSGKSLMGREGSSGSLEDYPRSPSEKERERDALSAPVSQRLTEPNSFGRREELRCVIAVIRQ